MWTSNMMGVVHHVAADGRDFFLCDDLSVIWAKKVIFIILKQTVSEGYQNKQVIYLLKPRFIQIQILTSIIINYSSHNALGV